VVLRVPVLYGDSNEPKKSAVNVLMDALWMSQEKDAMIRIDHWGHRYPTNIEDVARICVDVATKYLKEGEARQQLPEVLQLKIDSQSTRWWSFSLRLWV